MKANRLKSALIGIIFLLVQAFTVIACNDGNGIVRDIQNGAAQVINDSRAAFRANCGAALDMSCNGK